MINLVPKSDTISVFGFSIFLFVQKNFMHIIQVIEKPLSATSSGQNEVPIRKHDKLVKEKLKLYKIFLQKFSLHAFLKIKRKTFRYLTW